MPSPLAKTTLIFLSPNSLSSGIDFQCSVFVCACLITLLNFYFPFPFNRMPSHTRRSPSASTKFSSNGPHRRISPREFNSTPLLLRTAVSSGSLRNQTLWTSSRLNEPLLFLRKYFGGVSRIVTFLIVFNGFLNWITRYATKHFEEV